MTNSRPLRGSTKRTSSKRLRPGELDGLVLAYLRKHTKELPLGPTEVSHGIGRSSGAVANCLSRLAASGSLRLASEQPRRYEIAK
jgi:hypothetical protein